MKESTRARVAAVVGAATKGKVVTAVYDYAAAEYRNASVDVSRGRINGFDYSTSTCFSGGGEGTLDFYDYETSKDVQLKLEGSQFTGYDYHSGRSRAIRSRPAASSNYMSHEPWTHATVSIFEASARFFEASVR
jgi:hypothetical protein